MAGKVAGTLSGLEIGDSAIITSVGGDGALRQHFLDMGVIPGAKVTLVKYAPLGDPMEFELHGYALTLRVDEAARISCTSAMGDDERRVAAQRRASLDNEHPGLGEGGRYHVKATEDPLPEGETLTFALAGNQNCGKTTLFNQLTGANQHVGNFPGVTVDRKSGQIVGHSGTDVTDLPGIYSMSPYSPEEVVSRQFLLEEHPRGIINIVDATNMERNLYLTMQLMELNVPMVLALNMMDEMQGNGGSVRVNVMEGMLGIPVVPIAAVRNEGVGELVDHAIHVAKYQERPGRQDFCDASDHGGAVHRCLHAVMHLIEDNARRANMPLRFSATKLVEGDELVAESLHLDDDKRAAVESIVRQMEHERGLDRSAAIADMRYTFIRRVCDASVIKPRESRERERSQRIDRVLTGRFSAIPALIAIMGIGFYLAFHVVGLTLQDWMSAGVDWFSQAVANGLASAGATDAIVSLVVDGIIGGVGTVLVFLPIIVSMFFFLSLLEDTGYMARVAFVLDRTLRRLGLSGRSIVPMLMGFGCTVPAVMAARTLPSERDRKLTIFLVPFMSCSTKLTIYGFFASAFFPGHAALVTILLYVLGVVLAVISAYLGHTLVFKGEAVPFVMELPNYRMPGLKSVGRLVWNKSKDFISRAFTTIFVASVIIWFLQSFTLRLSFTPDPSVSMLAAIAGVAAPLFAPLGFGDWRVATALIVGFLAKETVVSTCQVLFGSVSQMVGAITPLAAAGLLVFCLLYTPCVAAIAAIRRELGNKWALGIMAFQCVVAWLCAFVVRLVGTALGL